MNNLARHLLPDSASVGADGRLEVGGRDLIDLAEEFGTPLFVYDEDHIRDKCRQVLAAFGEGATYAAKAFLCKTMARLVHEEGLRIDVATGGEMQVALSAGVPADRLVLHGNNKSDDELATAIEAGIGRIVVDSLDELDRIDRLASGPAAIPVLLRITPGIESHTHEHIATGQDDSKFGFTVSTGAAADAVTRALSAPHLDLRGVHCHIGSQVLRVNSYAGAVEAVAKFAHPYGFAELVVGGGLGVAYTSSETAPGIPEWSAVIHEAAERAGVGSQITVEPGRAIIATAGLTLYTVGTIKEIRGIRTYVSVDGGMSDNPRPVMYGSNYETFLPRAAYCDRDLPIRLVGKHCESGDIIVRNGWVPSDLAVGDIIGTPVTGAYGHAMGSNYNKVPRPPVVFVRDGEPRLVVRRETLDDLLATDLG